MRTASDLLAEVAKHEKALEALDTELIREIKLRVASDVKPDAWSRFLKLPGAQSRAAIGRLVKQFGLVRVDKAIESTLRLTPPPKNAMAYLIGVLRGVQSGSSIDKVGNELPPAI